MNGTEELRQHLAEAAGNGPAGYRIADAVLPVVERYGRECAAEALREAAEIAHCGVDQRRLDYRADALDGAQEAGRDA